MKKKLDEAAITNELRGGSAFFRDASEPAATLSDAQEDGMQDDPSVDQVVSRPTDRPAIKSAGRSASRLTDQSTNPSTSFDTSVVLGRPKAFYISERQDRDLDIAVEKVAERLKGRGNQKIDRSTVLRLLIEVNDITDDATAERLAGQFVSRLVSQLTG